MRMLAPSGRNQQVARTSDLLHWPVHPDRTFGVFHSDSWQVRRITSLRPWRRGCKFGRRKGRSRRYTDSDPLYRRHVESSLLLPAAPPAAKKRKTAATKTADPDEVTDEEEPEEISDENEPVAPPADEDEEEDGEDEAPDDAEEETVDTGKAATAAKKTKASAVPKENDLEEVEDDE